MDAPLPLSIAIITQNEELNLPRCLASVAGLATEIVVVDSGSTDETERIARTAGARFVSQAWQGHVGQKRTAFGYCTQPWVLSLDADEAVTTELAATVRALFADGEPRLAGYWVNRRTWYLGAWIRHVWSPEWRLRLARRSQAEWRGLDPSDRLEVQGPTERLAGDLLHYSYRDLRHHLEKTVQYARIAADAQAQAGRRCRPWHLLLSPVAAWARQLVVRGAWRDGWRGHIIAGATAFRVFAKYAFLLERQLAAHASPARDHDP